MKTSDFVSLLQREFVLSRDPHIADRFAALLDEHFESKPVEPSESDPTLSTDSGQQETPTPASDSTTQTDPTSDGSSESTSIESEAVAADPTESGSPAPNGASSGDESTTSSTTAV